MLFLRLKEVFSNVGCGVECSEWPGVHVVKIFQAFILKCLLVLFGQIYQRIENSLFFSNEYFF